MKIYNRTLSQDLDLDSDQKWAKIQVADPHSMCLVLQLGLKNLKYKYEFSFWCVRHFFTHSRIRNVSYTADTDPHNRKKNCDLNSETALTFYRKLSSEVRKKRQHWKQEVKNRIIGSGSAFYLEAAMLKHDIPTDPVIRTMTFKYRRKQARCSGS